MKQKDIRASITVEAAYVMPIIIFAIFALIYLAFYLHDRCRIQGEFDKVLHKAGITVKHDVNIKTGEFAYDNINGRGVFYLITGGTEEVEEQMEAYLQKELARGLFLYRITAVTAEYNKFKITFSIEAERKIRIPYFTRVFQSYAIMKITGDCPVHNPAETIRCSEVILETGSEIKGIDEIKEKLEHFLGLN